MFIGIYKLIFSFILGIVAGITEFLPISSTGHIILIENFLNCVHDDSVQFFTIIIQLGSIFSILIMFWKKLFDISKNCIPKVFLKKHYDNKHLCIQHMCVGTLPGVIFGLFFYQEIRLLLFDPIYVAHGLTIGSIFLLFGELRLFKSSSLSLNCISRIDNITYFQVFLIGCFQCLAFFPGFSRSGSTIGGGLLVGLDRRIASEFSFFLAIPIILGSIILTIYHYRDLSINLIDACVLIMGCTTTFLVSILTIRFFLKIIKSVSLVPFIMYRIILALGIYLIY